MHNEGGTHSPLFSLCFTPINGATYTLLGDFKPMDGTSIVEDDCIQVIDPTSLAATKLFTYLDKTIADEIAVDEGGQPGDYDEFIGWWDEGIGIFEDDAKVDDYQVNIGDGFMGYFESESEVTFQSNGEAPTVSTSFTPNSEGTRSPVFANYIPRDITLKYMAPVDGMAIVEDDCIQVIDPTSLASTELFTYLDKTIADEIAVDEGGEPGDYDEFIGWWDEGIGIFEDDARVDDFVVKAGFGFMGYFEAGNEITFQLPSSTATLD